MASGSSSRSAASVSRQSVRKAIGGSPTSSVKRRANAARETPARSASSATVHGCSGWCCISRSAGPTTGSPCAAYHAGGSDCGRVEPGAQQGDQQQVEQPVEHRLLTRRVADHLLAEQVEQRGVELVGAQHQRARQGADQPPGHLALHQVDAGEQHGLADLAVAPAADPLAHLLDHDVAVDRACRPGRGGSRPGSACAGRRRSSSGRCRPRPRRRRPRAGSAPRRRGRPTGGPRTTAVTDSGASSWSRTDHGASSRIRSRNAPRARGPSSSPASPSIRHVDARVCIEQIQPWIVSPDRGGLLP